MKIMISNFWKKRISKNKDKTDKMARSIRNAVILADKFAKGAFL